MIRMKPLVKEDVHKDIQIVKQFREKWFNAIKSKKVIYAGGPADYMRFAKPGDRTAMILGMFTVVGSEPRLNRYNKFTQSWSSGFESLFTAWKKTGDMVIVRLLNPHDVNKLMEH